MAEISKIGAPPPELYGLGASYVGAYAAIWGSKETKKRMNDIQSTAHEDIASTCGVKLTPQQFGKLKESDAWRNFQNDRTTRSIHDFLTISLLPTGILVFSAGMTVLIGEAPLRKEDMGNILTGLMMFISVAVVGSTYLMLFQILPQLRQLPKVPNYYHPVCRAARHIAEAEIPSPAPEMQYSYINDPPLEKTFWDEAIFFVPVAIYAGIEAAALGVLTYEGLATTAATAEAFAY